MTWTLTFDQTKKTIGNLTASFDNLVVHQNSVNIENTASVADFIATAKNLKDSPADSADTARVVSLLETITAQINAQ